MEWGGGRNRNGDGGFYYCYGVNTTGAVFGVGGTCN